MPQELSPKRINSARLELHDMAVLWLAEYQSVPELEREYKVVTRFVEDLFDIKVTPELLTKVINDEDTAIHEQYEDAPRTSNSTAALGLHELTILWLACYGNRPVFTEIAKLVDEVAKESTVLADTL
jgi:hypothetical protein